MLSICTNNTNIFAKFTEVIHASVPFMSPSQQDSLRILNPLGYTQRQGGPRPTKSCVYPSSMNK